MSNIECRMSNVEVKTGNFFRPTASVQAGLSGQALIELCVCLVAIVVVLAGLLQLTTLTMMQTETMMEARAEAASAAMAEIALVPSVPYIKTWTESPRNAEGDDVRYTADDEASTIKNTESFFNTMPDKSVSDASEWNVFEDDQNPFVTMHSSRGIPSSYFGLVKGDASATTNILNAFRSLIYSNDSITINSEVWMTRTKGIY